MPESFSNDVLISVVQKYFPDEERTVLIKLLDKHIQVFDRPVKSSLWHMDVWAQNILADGKGNLTGLVDWDRAVWGDPEIEFSVLDYCGVSTPAFWEGYGREPEQTDEARIRGIFYLLYEHQKYIVIREGRSGNSDVARQYRNQCFQMVKQYFG